MRCAVILLVAAVALAAHPARAAVWEISGWDRPAQANNQLQTFTKARCGDTIKISCAPGTKSGIYRMNDPSGWCPPTWDATTGKALSPVKEDCGAEFTIGDGDRTFFLTSQGEGDCEAGLKMNVKLPPCGLSVGYAVPLAKLAAAAAKDAAASAASKNATAAALVPAARAFNASAPAAAVGGGAAPAPALSSAGGGIAAVGSVAAAVTAAALAFVAVVVA